MSKEVPEKTLSALKATDEIRQNCPDLLEQLRQILTTVDVEEVGRLIQSQELYILLDQYASTKEFLDKDSEKISLLLVQYLLIHYYINLSNCELGNFEELKQFVIGHPKLKKILGDRNGSSKIIIYQDYFTGCRWNKYASLSKGDWQEINLLDESLPNCSVEVDSLFHYVQSAVSAHPNDYGVPRLGRNIVAKIESDNKLKNQIEENIPKIISTEHLNTFLPSFLVSIIKSENDFERWFTDLTSKYDLYKAHTVLYALGVACPSEQSSLEKYKDEIEKCIGIGKISSAECVQLYTLKNFKSNDTLDYLVQLSSSTTNSDDLTALLQFLINNLDTDIDSEWFRTILKNLFLIEDDKNIGTLSYLIHLLIEKDIDLAYQIFDIRFEHLGSKNFIREYWHELVEADKTLFSRQVTKWLNSDVTNVHKALLRLCTVNEIAPSDFKINTELFNTLSIRDKLYITIKIIGFVYSKDHLQSLMFSLVECTRSEETALIDNLFMLFYNYVIYNYRTSLDTIKEILKDKNLPDHLFKFYDDLNNSYEQYFKDLGMIEAYPELKPDIVLVQHIQFYTQNQFSEKSKKVKKTGLASLFKNTPIHSHRWAIRRENEPVHKPAPLGHFSTSIEFPSGERLNPIYQETMRRTYQRMKRNEIDIN